MKTIEERLNGQGDKEKLYDLYKKVTEMAKKEIDKVPLEKRLLSIIFGSEMENTDSRCVYNDLPESEMLNFFCPIYAEYKVKMGDIFPQVFNLGESEEV